MATWHLGPIVRGMRGHRAAAVLVALQLGIGLAITVLAVLVGDYMLRGAQVSSGFAEAELTLLELRIPGRSAGGAEAERRHAELLEEARAIPGCVAAATVGQPPLDALEHGPDYVKRAPDDAALVAYELEAGPGIAEAAGLRLVAGRDFTEEDLGGPVAAAILSRSFAETLFPGQDPLGAEFRSRAYGPARVVGVAERMRTHAFGRGDPNVLYARDDARAPRTLALVRSAPGRAEQVRAALRARLARPGEFLTAVPAAAHLQSEASAARSALGIVLVMIGAIIVVVLTGSMGMTYFLVAKRAHEIGLRRAMGATRRDVVLHFLLETLIFTAAGTLTGVGLVLLALPSLVRHQDGFVVRWWLIAATTAAVALFNLAVTLVPARNAAAVPPVVASRTV